MPPKNVIRHPPVLSAYLHKQPAKNATNTTTANNTTNSTKTQHAQPTATSKAVASAAQGSTSANVGRPLTFIPQLEPFCTSLNLYTAWLLAQRPSNSRQSNRNVANTPSLPPLAKLHYSEIVVVLQYAASRLHFHVQNTWSDSGSDWKSPPPDFVVIERPRLSLERGIRITMSAEIDGDEIQTSKFTTGVGSEGENVTVIRWGDDEPGARRSGKPKLGEIKVYFVPPQQGGPLFRGICQHHGEGLLGYYGRLKTFDAKTGQETTMPVKRYWKDGLPGGQSPRFDPEVEAAKKARGQPTGFGRGCRSYSDSD